MTPLIFTITLFNLCSSHLPGIQESRFPHLKRGVADSLFCGLVPGPEETRHFPKVCGFCSDTGYFQDISGSQHDRSSPPHTANLRGNVSLMAWNESYFPTAPLNSLMGKCMQSLGSESPQRIANFFSNIECLHSSSTQKELIHLFLHLLSMEY